MARSSHWRRDASSPFQMLQRELNQLLESYLAPARCGSHEPPPTDLDPTAWSPAVDVYDAPEELLITVEIPGVDPGSVELAVTGNLLTLRGVKQAVDLPEAQHQVRERRFGAFHRQIALPNEVDFNGAQAEASQGVLKIRLPKQTAAKPRTIPIRPG
jgi:HSP20 family protein